MPSTPTYPQFTGSEPCTQVGTDHYFTHDDKPTYDNLRTIKAMCGTCPSKEPCLDYALRVNVQGIWGGTVEHERMSLRRSLGITAVPLFLTYVATPPTRDALLKREWRAAQKRSA